VPRAAPIASQESPFARAALTAASNSASAFAAGVRAAVIRRKSVLLTGRGVKRLAGVNLVDLAVAGVPVHCLKATNLP
jgi:hypothetical protein